MHLDWHEYKGKQIIFAEDDASRMILAGGEFGSANEGNTITVMKEAMKIASLWNSSIRQALTDNGSQFTIPRKFNEECEVSLANHGFERFLADVGIEHVYARPHHPQTNGKLERLFETHDMKRHHFKNLNEFIEWYNTLKPHISLDYDTPIVGFRRKLRAEELIGLAYKTFKW